MLSNVLRGTRHERVESRKSGAQAACGAIDVKLVKANSNYNEVVELQIQQVAYDISLQELTEELTEVKA